MPFSASNYLLGLMPVQVPSFLGGTVAGMAVWSVLYASLGGASRKLLDNGADVGALLQGAQNGGMCVLRGLCCMLLVLPHTKWLAHLASRLSRTLL